MCRIPQVVVNDGVLNPLLSGLVDVIDFDRLLAVVAIKSVNAP